MKKRNLTKPNIFRLKERADSGLFDAMHQDRFQYFDLGEHASLSVWVTSTLVQDSDLIVRFLDVSYLEVAAVVRRRGTLYKFISRARVVLNPSYHDPSASDFVEEQVQFNVSAGELLDLTSPCWTLVPG